MNIFNDKDSASYIDTVSKILLAVIAVLVAAEIIHEILI